MGSVAPDCFDTISPTAASRDGAVPGGERLGVIVAEIIGNGGPHLIVGHQRRALVTAWVVKRCTGLKVVSISRAALLAALAESRGGA